MFGGLFRPVGTLGFLRHSCPLLFSDNKASVQFLGRPRWRKAAFSHSNGSKLREFTSGKGERSMALDGRHRGKNGEISRKQSATITWSTLVLAQQSPRLD